MLQSRSDGPFRTTETHLSWLVHVGPYVLKAKKPVSTPFLDLTTLAARERVTAQEVALNRRLAPDVYLGVAHLSGAAGLHEPVVVMRRMPDERRLALLAARGDDLRREVTDLADLLARFHRQARVVPASGTPAEVRRLWRDNTEQLRTLPSSDPAQVEAVQALADRYLAGREPLLLHRVEQQRIRDGHGDLLADDVFLLDDGPRVLDCLEFDERLRCGDVLSDVAFLAMDLERVGRPDLGQLLLARHRQAAADDWPPSLAEHWVAYRAQVRAKVAALRAEQGDPDAPDQARLLLELSARHLSRAQVRLVLVGGAPGTGKSTLARALADLAGWSLLRSDVVRRTVARDRPATGRLDEGRYRPEVSDQVMAELLRQAQELLGQGRSVVLDATWCSATWREQARDLADCRSADLLALRTSLPEETADARLRARAAAGDDPSDATPEVAAALRRRAAPWPGALVVDTGGSPDEALGRALEGLRDAGCALAVS